ncbi:MAG: DUF3592 domain-containing protein [Xanthomonadales bacterium]|nr:DUF3592 domain-containing protein [Xanthomonadales bacterium]
MTFLRSTWLWARDLLFAAIFIIVGIVFVVWPIGPLLEYHDISGWQAQDCMIESFWFEQEKPTVSSELKVRYIYRFGDQSYASERLAQQPIKFMDPGDAGPIVSAMTPGADHPCFVNPDKPSEAILLKPFKIEVFVWRFGLLLGICFLVTGALSLRKAGQEYE